MQTLSLMHTVTVDIFSLRHCHLSWSEYGGGGSDGEGLTA